MSERSAVGIEGINAYLGAASVPVRSIFEARGLNLERFDNLMMKEKAVGLPCEDPVTNAVNAAKPIIDRLTEEERGRIEWVITGSESGLDFGKSLANYVHDLLDLPKTCRVFETKQACFAGTGALQTVVGALASKMSPGAKALVIATDIDEFAVSRPERVEGVTTENYAEPSSGTGAVAVLLSTAPRLFAFDLGAYGLHSFEVMDTFRPIPGETFGDPDLSLLSYMDCAVGAVGDYLSRVEGANYRDTFAYLGFHTPFGGMVKGTHRKLMRKYAGVKPTESEADFNVRVAPSLKYCERVGNVYSATTFLALCGILEEAVPGERHRVGLFSYGSGCSSEFYSGVMGANAGKLMREMDMEGALARRHSLSFAEYEALIGASTGAAFGTRESKVDVSTFEPVYERFFRGSGLLVLTEINNFHRSYTWS